MTRKARSDSISEAVRIMGGCGKPVSLPEHIKLGKSDQPYMASIMAQRARVDWTNHDLEIAADLARMISDLQSERKKLRSEGSVYEDEGRMTKNPRVDIVRKLEGNILSHRRSLGLHARAQQGDPQKAGPRMAKAREAEANMAEAQEDGLLAS